MYQIQINFVCYGQHQENWPTIWLPGFFLLARGWFIKNATGVLWYSSYEIAHRVKTQARSQNSRSRALKWGIVCLYSSSSFGDIYEIYENMSFEIFPFL